MPAATIYAGPGKLFLLTAPPNGVVLWPQQENGQMVYAISQAKQDFANTMFGRVGSTLGGTLGKVSLTPYDNWAALPALYPTYIGATTVSGVGFGAGALVVGTRPHNPLAAADIVGKLWNPDGLLIAVNRLAVTRHPDMHLGVGKPLFGQVELTALQSSTNGAGPVAIGTAAAFHTITETGAADPGGVMTTGDFVREAWVGNWTGSAAFANIQAEDEWTISCNARYDELKVQEQTLAMKLASVEFMAKCRPYGPQWTDIESAVLTNRLLGSRWANPGTQAAAKSLTLTSTSSGKTIQLPNVDVQGENFEFGGTRLTTGEVGFVSQLQFNAGAPQPLIIFSA